MGPKEFAEAGAATASAPAKAELMAAVLIRFRLVNRIVTVSFCWVLKSGCFVLVAVQL